MLLNLPLFSLLFLIGFAFSFWIGYLVFRFGPKNRTNIFFMATMFSISIYMFSAFIVYNLPLGSLAMLFEKIGFIGAIMVPAFFFHFIVYFPDKKEISRFWKYLISLIYIYMVVLFILVPGKMMLTDIKEINYIRFSKTGDLYFLYLIYLVSVDLGAIFIAFWKLFNLKEIRKKQVGFVLIGSIIAVVGAILETRPLVGELFIPISSITTSIMGVLIGYAIIRYGAFDVEKLVKEGFFISIATSLATIFYFVFIYIIFQNIIRNSMSSTFMIHLIFLVLIIIGFQPLKETLDKFIQSKFFGDFYYYRGIIENFSQTLPHNLDFGQLSESIINILMKSISLNLVIISLFDPKDKSYSIISSDKDKYKNNIFYLINGKYISESPNEDGWIEWKLGNGKEKSFKEYFYSNFDGQKLLTFPLIAKQKHLGFLGLGTKKNGQKYSQADCKLLKALSVQTAYSIENAQLYKTVVAQKNKLNILNRQLESAYDVERERISRELHDRVAQSLAGAILSIDFLKRQCSNKNNKCKNEINIIHEEVREAIVQMREIIYQLREKLKSEYNMIEEIQKFTRSFCENNNLNLVISVDDFPGSINDSQARIIIRIIKELFYNITKHAQASNINFKLFSQESKIKMIIEDDGVGFLVQKVFKNFQKMRTFGLVSIRENINELNGNLKIISKIGKGTKVEIIIDEVELIY